MEWPVSTVWGETNRTSVEWSNTHARMANTNGNLNHAQLNRKGSHNTWTNPFDSKSDVQTYIIMHYFNWLAIQTIQSQHTEQLYNVTTAKQCCATDSLLSHWPRHKTDKWSQLAVVLQVHVSMFRCVMGILYCSKETFKWAAAAAAAAVAIAAVNICTETVGTAVCDHNLTINNLRNNKICHSNKYCEDFIILDCTKCVV